MRAREAHGFGRRDVALVDVVLDEPHVGAVVAIEDQREALVVLHAEDRERGEALRVGLHAAGVDALAHELLADEAPEMLVADAGDEPGLEAEPRCPDRGVGRAAADRLRERRHILEPPADLLSVEVDGGAADGDDVERGAHWCTSPGGRGSLSARTPLPGGLRHSHIEGRRRAPPSPRSRSEWRGGPTRAKPERGGGCFPEALRRRSGAGVDGCPGPTAASSSSPSRLAQPPPTPTPPRHSASPSGGREEREADMCESGNPGGRGAGVRDRPRDRSLGRLRREGRSLTRSRSARLDLSHSGEVCARAALNARPSAPDAARSRSSRRPTGRNRSPRRSSAPTRR